MKYKKTIIFCSILGVLIVTLLLCLIDYNSYYASSKHIECDENGIILSINTFDGENESTFFVKSLGHSWISIDNKTDEDISINSITIKKDETLTISVYAIEGQNCVVFNLEPYYINDSNRYNGRVSLSTSINKEDLNKIEEYCNNSKGWKLLKNCSYFSINLWNNIVKSEYKINTQVLMYTPTRLKRAILEYDNYIINKIYNTKNMYILEKNVVSEVKICEGK